MAKEKKGLWLPFRQPGVCVYLESWDLMLFQSLIYKSVGFPILTRWHSKYKKYLSSFSFLSELTLNNITKRNFSVSLLFRFDLGIHRAIIS